MRIPFLAFSTLALATLLSLATVSATAEENPPHMPVIEKVTNPTSKAALAVYERPPKDKGRNPTVVVVPGGTRGAMNTLTTASRKALTEAGYAIYFFDPDGRDLSGGSEDFNGTIHQDGLKAVLDWVATRSDVDPDRIAVLSLSMGVGMSSGALARYDTPAKFLLDWEGPATRWTTPHCNKNSPKAPAAGPQFGPCDDDGWWKNREAATWLPKLRVPYQRLQYKTHHVLGTDYTPTVQAMQAVASGKVPWFRLNDDAPGTAPATVADVKPLADGDPGADFVRMLDDLMKRFGGKK